MTQTIEQKKNLARAQMELMGCWEWEIIAALARIDAEEKMSEPLIYADFSDYADCDFTDYC